MGYTPEVDFNMLISHTNLYKQSPSTASALEIMESMNIKLVVGFESILIIMHKTLK